jgi:ADP-ribose pyrophosphatase
MKTKLFSTAEFDILHKYFRVVTSKGALVKGDVTYITHPDTAVCVYINEQSEYLLLNQYRPIFNDWFIELPGGLVLNKESPRQAAIREFKEETGYNPLRLEKLFTIIPTIGLSKEKIHIFRVTKISSSHQQRLEQDEAIKLVWIKKKDVIGMIKKGAIVDAKTIIGILALKHIFI